MLILDLDNTLWGGVIGDDGLDGIILGQGSPAGEAYLEIQRVALNLRKRGVVLAVCSKNEEENARQPFREHPEMLLSEDDIAVFVANWQDKATNIKAIADSLNLGVDSMVLLDDNPAERTLVRGMLPEVGVPELPSDPARFASILLSGGYFEAVSFSDEDTLRAAQYRSNVLRTKAKAEFSDLNDYLPSLNMRINFTPFDQLGRKRIAQLINKTNQFNLTTRRYTEMEVEAIEKNKRYWTLQFRLEDRFGDNGMIGVVICEAVSSIQWDIDTWLMSCRVLGRRVEQETLNEIVRAAAANDVQTITGRYIPTRKNKLVESHYSDLGFHFDHSDGDSTLWTLDIGQFTPFESVMSETVSAYGFSHSRIEN